MFIFYSYLIYDYLPSFGKNTVAHMQTSSITSAELSFPNVRTLSSNQMVVSNSGREELRRTTVRTIIGLGSTAWLPVFTTIRIEVSITTWVHNT